MEVWEGVAGGGAGGKRTPGLAWGRGRREAGTGTALHTEELQESSRQR